MLNTMLSARNKREIRISVIKNLWSSGGERQRVELKQYRMINTETEGCWGQGVGGQRKGVAKIFWSR